MANSNHIHVASPRAGSCYETGNNFFAIPNYTEFHVTAFSLMPFHSTLGVDGQIAKFETTLRKPSRIDIV
jgi:hypothetical protein